jgi:hypothetical protein
MMSVASGATAVPNYDQPTVDLGAEAPLRQIDTSGFRAWFGASKVVDETGEPLVAFHGTEAVFDAFSRDGSAEGAIFFSKGEDAAKRFGRNLMPCFLYITNPLVVDGSALPIEHELEDMERLIDEARDKGCDGLIILGFRDQIETPVDTFTVFDPDQIMRVSQPIKVSVSDLWLNPDGLGTARGAWFWTPDFRVTNNEPVAVMRVPGRGLYLLDGYHRVVQATRDGRKELDALEVPYNKARLASEGDPKDWTRCKVNGQKSTVGLGSEPPVRQLETPEFKAWFGQSKVVGADGEPLVVHHGTHEKFKQFEIGRVTKNFMWGMGMDVARLGAFFSTERAQAKSFAKDGGTVLPVYLSIQKPANLHGGFSNEIWETFHDLLHDWNIHIQEPNKMWELFDTGTVGGPEFVAALKAHGYDGARIEEDGCEVWVAFEPTQIKHAKKNCGVFDPANPDICR